MEIECYYGCGQPAKYHFKTVDKWCCSPNFSQCPAVRKTRKGLLKGRPSPFKGRKHSDETKKKISEKKLGELRDSKTKEKLRKFRIGKTYEQLYGDDKAKEIKHKISISGKGKKSRNKNKTLEQLYGEDKAKELKKKIGKANLNKKPWNLYSINYFKKYHKDFLLIEDVRKNPKNKKFQVRCKNHNCKNSKEKGGWFTPSKRQITDRLSNIKKSDGNGSYFYCCDECKQECPLYGKSAIQLINEDKIKIGLIKEPLYTSEEYNTWRQEVLKRADYKCEYCGAEATHSHHIEPQKLQPGFALDPDNGLACCEGCHYKYGHKTGTECSTGNLANKIC